MTAAFDGIQLANYRWTVPASAGKSRGLYLLHGMSEYAGRYEHVAGWLNARGWEVAAHDHRGHGRSHGKRASARRGTDLIEDAEERIAAYANASGEPPVLLGHSMGGLIAAHVALRGRVPLAGLILCSPAFRLRLTLAQRGLLRVLRRVAPGLRVPNLRRRSVLSHDQVVTDAYAVDPLVNRVVTARMVGFIDDHGAAAIAGAPRLPCRTLLLVAGADAVVDSAGSRDFAHAAPPGRLALRWHDQAWHELFNETPEIAGPVFADLDAWLSELRATRNAL